MKNCLDLYRRGDQRVDVPLPHEIHSKLKNPPDLLEDKYLDRIHGSLLGLAIGDALGAHVEFRPRAYMVEHQVKELESGGTWGLKKGQVG